MRGRENAQPHCVACDADMQVDTSRDEGRCSGCGTKYAAPWDAPEVLSSPLLSDEEIQQVNASAIEAASAGPNADEAIQTREAPVTVRITIEVVSE